MNESEWKVASSQSMLQSFYSEREQRLRQQPIPPSPTRPPTGTLHLRTRSCVLQKSFAVSACSWRNPDETPATAVLYAKIKCLPRGSLLHCLDFSILRPQAILLIVIY